MSINRNFEKKLRSVGLRPTRQRLDICEVLFDRKEIVLYNKVFGISSTFNINTKIWTSYKGLFIKIYRCEQKKRRF